MARLVVTEFVSVDGVMEAPGGEPGYAHTGWVWRLFSDELGAYKLEEHLAADVLLLGRRTYESFHGAWPDRDGPMADKLNTMPKYVASTTLRTVEWQSSQLLDGPVPEAVARLKASLDGQILVAGSRTLVHTLLAAGLVDQLNLQVFPLALGSGARLLPDRADVTELSLISSRAIDRGVLVQSYEVVGGPRVVSASREVAAGAAEIFELIADPARQASWDGNDNLQGAAPGQRVTGVGDVFLMTLHPSAVSPNPVRQNHVVEFEEGRRIAWTPSEPGATPPGHLWRWELEPLDARRTRVTHTYDWTRLTDPKRMSRARSTTPDRLRASMDRLAALAESSPA